MARRYRIKFMPISIGKPNERTVYVDGKAVGTYCWKETDLRGRDSELHIQQEVTLTLGALEAIGRKGVREFVRSDDEPVGSLGDGEE